MAKYNYSYQTITIVYRLWGDHKHEKLSKYYSWCKDDDEIIERIYDDIYKSLIEELNKSYTNLDLVNIVKIRLGSYVTQEDINRYSSYKHYKEPCNLIKVDCLFKTAVPEVSFTDLKLEQRVDKLTTVIQHLQRSIEKLTDPDTMNIDPDGLKL